MGDSPIPEHLLTTEQYAEVMALSASYPQCLQQNWMTAFLKSQCRHVISVPGCAYQIALLANPTTGKLVAYYDDYDADPLARTLKNLEQPFPQVYSSELTKEMLLAQGFEFTEVYHAESGVFEYEAQKPAPEAWEKEIQS